MIPLGVIGVVIAAGTKENMGGKKTGKIRQKKKIRRIKLNKAQHLTPVDLRVCFSGCLPLMWCTCSHAYWVFVECVIEFKMCILTCVLVS